MPGQKRVLVIGDFMYDKYHYGNTTKISCEASLPVFGKSSSEVRYGGAGNVALTCHQHAETTLYAALCDDDFPETQFRFVNLPGKTVTTIKERFIIGQKQVFRSDQERYEPINIDDINTDGYDVIVISDYNKGVIHSPERLIGKANCPVIVDPKDSDWSKYKGAYCLKPNLKDFENICGKFTLENARRAIKTYNLEAILVTLGADGVTWVTSSEEIYLASTCTADHVIDVTGAGDTFISIFACYFDPDNIKNSLTIANKAAGITVQHFGTYAVNQNDIQGHSQQEDMEKQDKEIDRVRVDRNLGKTQDGTLIQKVLPIVQLQEKAMHEMSEETGDGTGIAGEKPDSTNKKKKEVVVFTNGCFDIIHVTHVNLLQKARNLGDKLIVGLNSDASVTRIKRRPINNQARRKMLLEAFSFVDVVIIFDEDTPCSLIKQLKPDILVKGGDYQVEDLKSRELVGKAIIIPNYCEVTTSRIMNECHKRKIESDCKKKILPEQYAEAFGSPDWSCVKDRENEVCLLCEQTDRTSQQIVPKKWGYEKIFVSNPLYAGKFLHFDKAGNKFSMHLHVVKTESWYVLSGSFHLVLINTSDASRRSIKLTAGEVWHMKPLEPHQLMAMEDHSIIIEVSTADNKEDNYRVEPGDNQM